MAFGARRSEDVALSPRGLTITFFLALALGSARADERGLVDRPMLLAPRHVNVTLGASLTNLQNFDTGAALAAGVDIGLAPGAQAGLYLAVPVYPHAGFGAAIGNVQIGLDSTLNLRFDVGVEHNDIGQTSFITGVGAPWKRKLHKMVALVSGSTAARGFGPPLDAWYGPYGVPDTPTFGPTVELSNDVLAIQVLHRDLGGTQLVGSFHLPVGVVFQPHPIFSASLRVGYRLLFRHLPNDLEGGGAQVALESLLPVAGDLLLSPTRWLDIGFTATVAGLIDRQLDQAISPGSGWRSLRIFELWIGFHP